MYKLVVVAGKMRGQEFELEEGESIVGRDSECDVHVDVDGVSKRHLSITVTGETAYIKDLGSSNGTFLNGEVVKAATVKDKDKIVLPDTIIQVVHVQEKKVIIKKRVDAEDEDDDPLKGGPVPTKLGEKIIYYFKHKFMPIIYGVNEEYEWKILFSILLVVFVVINITLTIFPILQDSKKILLEETKKRGAHYAEEIGRMNSKALEQKDLDRVDTNFLENEDGVASYELFDLDGRIVRPIGKLNEYISDSLSSEVRTWAIKTRKGNGNQVFKKTMPNGEIGIGKKIMAYNDKSASLEPVGVIAIRFAPRSLAVEAAKSSKAYLESLTTSFIVGVMFFAMVYYLTTRHVEEMTFQIEEALKGRRKNLESRYLFGELKPLRNSINSILQRLRELQSEEEGDFMEEEDASKYLMILDQFIIGANGPAMVLDAQKQVRKINVDAEDVTGIRESSAEGMSILDVAREQGFAATLMELCDNSSASDGDCAEGEYDLQGVPYRLYCISLMGKDSLAKGHFITFNKDA